MKLLIIGIVLIASITVALSADVRLVDLEPNDAAQYINRQDQTLRYAPRIDTHVPAVRYLGNQQQRVLEDIYLANQYHGQDGLGAYIYGYSVPDIAKTEKKERSGDLKGAYEYIAGNGQEIKVQYWDDGTGFHQIDNVPKNLPEDDPDVKAAKEEHLRIWHEQALRNSIPPTDPNQQYFQQQQQHPQQQQHTQQQHHPQQQQPIAQEVPRYQPQPNSQTNVNRQTAYAGLHQVYQAQPVPPRVVPLHPNSVEYTGQYSSNQQTYAAPASGQSSVVRTSNEQTWAQGPAVSASQVETQKTRPPQGFNTVHQSSQDARVALTSTKRDEDEEQTGPPKGFFYSFDYPVGIIVGKEGQQLNSIYQQNKDLHEQQLKAKVSA